METIYFLLHNSYWRCNVILLDMCTSSPLRPLLHPNITPPLAGNVYFCDLRSGAFVHFISRDLSSKSNMYRCVWSECVRHAPLQVCVWGVWCETCPTTGMCLRRVVWDMPHFGCVRHAPLQECVWGVWCGTYPLQVCLKLVVWSMLHYRCVWGVWCGTCPTTGVVWDMLHFRCVWSVWCGTCTTTAVFGACGVWHTPLQTCGELCFPHFLSSCSLKSSTFIFYSGSQTSTKGVS